MTDWNNSKTSLAESTDGRDRIDESGQKIAEAGTGISIFDPTLCELMYSWFSPEQAIILDPFAGGSVRGIVAAELNRNYVGIELRKEQVDANREQAARICKGNMPIWHCGDSSEIKTIVDQQVDMIFTCPPYADLEVYSDDPKDISTMDYPEFLESYRKILKHTADLLKEDRFAAIVVGEVRDKKTGIYYGFVPDTIRAMQDAGLKYYNEIILVTAIGSLPLRAGKTFSASRKIGKTHQNILIFVKGDPKRATQYCGDVTIKELPETGVGAGE